MDPIVRKNNGYIDKYIGDIIMALFKKSAIDAIKTSVEMLNSLRDFNVYRIKKGDVPIHVGIGVNTGKMILGTLGESDRMEGSVISDAVNIATKLEGLTKFYKTPLLISDETLSKSVGLNFPIRLIDKVSVKGKEKPISVY